MAADKGASTPTSDHLLHQLLALHPKRIDLSIGRMLDLLEKLGNPQLALPPVVHIAGTNGKGSTLAFLRAMAQADGRKVHTYTSPHLVRFHERIGLYGAPIAEPDLAALLAEVEAVNAGEPITFFEVTTAAAFLAFSRNPADLLILETGLGGRLDATNVVARPLAVGLTPIGLDHQGFLGDTIEAIAGEKAGIIKPNVPAFTAAQVPQAMQVLAAKADKVGTTLQQSAEAPTAWQLGLKGAHQYQNAGLAADLARQIGLSPEAIQRGAAKAQWPGRLQQLTDGPWLRQLPAGCQLWLDGAHNQAAAQHLSAWVAKQPGQITVVLGLMNTREPQEFLEPFVPLGERVKFLALAIPGEANAHDVAVVAQGGRNLGLRIDVAEGLDGAFAKIGAQETPPQLVLVAGSLYLIGAFLRGDAPNVSEYGSSLSKP